MKILDDSTQVISDYHLMPFDTITIDEGRRDHAAAGIRRNVFGDHSHPFRKVGACALIGCGGIHGLQQAQRLPRRGPAQKRRIRAHGPHRIPDADGIRPIHRREDLRAPQHPGAVPYAHRRGRENRHRGRLQGGALHQRRDL